MSTESVPLANASNASEVFIEVRTLVPAPNFHVLRFSCSFNSHSFLRPLAHVSLQFAVKWRSNTFMVHVPASATLESVKLSLEDRTGVDVAAQKLLNIKQIGGKPATDATLVGQVVGTAAAQCSAETLAAADAEAAAAATAAASEAELETATKVAVAATDADEAEGATPTSPAAPRPAAPVVDAARSSAPVRALLIGTPAAERVVGEVSASVVNDLDENAPDYVYPSFADEDLLRLQTCLHTRAALEATLTRLQTGLLDSPHATAL